MSSAGVSRGQLDRVVNGSPYVADIRAQPAALVQLVDASRYPLWQDIELSRHDRVIFTGMGASHFAAREAWLRLVSAGFAAWWIETNRLLDGSDGLISSGSLLVVTSQSGRSAEVVELLNRRAPRRPGLLVGVTNDPTSPLAEQADRVIDLCSGVEHSVGTRSFANSVASLELVVATLLGRPDPRAAIAVAADAIRTFLGHANELAGRIEAADVAIGLPDQLVLVGRGHAITAALQGALLLKEAAKIHAEGMSAGEFRHGPIELAGPSLTLLLIEGPADSLPLDHRLASDLARGGARVVWMGQHAPADMARLDVRMAGDFGNSLMQVVSVQVASIALALRGGHEPGIFRTASKVTTLL